MKCAVNLTNNMAKIEQEHKIKNKKSANHYPNL